MMTISAFKWVPEFAQGQVRDLRALGAGGSYRAPYGQVPIHEEDGLVLFETGAIMLHVGEQSETLLPKDPSGRARDSMADRGAQFHRTVRYERRHDRSLLCE